MSRAYRDDDAALRLQIEALRERLAAAEDDRDEHERLHAELDAALNELKDQRLTEAEHQTAARRIGKRYLLLGSALAVGVISVSVGAALWFEQTSQAAGASTTNDASLWFSAARAHCNPVEAASYIKAHPPPVEDPNSSGYAAACHALAHRIDDARALLEKTPGPDRAKAVQIVFNIVHPIADAGDDVAAGPVMELVLEFWPNNYMAQFHAGMAAYQKADDVRARRHLDRFMVTYNKDDTWRARARKALAAMDGIAAGESQERPTIPIH
jgi:cytochrome c-type biogenesis protein CcmH/NrfG